MDTIGRPATALALTLGLFAVPLLATEAAAAPAGDAVIINEAYVNGGSSNAPYRNKFVELYNTGSTPVSLEGWSIQYRSATGTSSPTAVAALSGTIAPKSFYLVQGSSNGSTGAALPAPDLASGALNFSGTKGTIVLAKSTAALSPLATGSVVNDSRVADLIGYGPTNTFETAAGPAPSSTSDPRSIDRTAHRDTDVNADDFALTSTVTPQNTSSPADDGGSGNPGPAPTPLPPDYRTIEDIQGTGDSSPLASSTVSTRGKVTAVYPSGGFNGYYIQTPGTGGTIDFGTHTASSGIFVSSSATVGQVKAGDHVQVRGTVQESFGLTQISVPAGGATVLPDAAPEVKGALVGLPAEPHREALEGMLVTPQGPFTVTDNYNLNKYGELGVTDGTSPLLSPTTQAEPGAAAAAAAASNSAHTVTLDDGSTTNFLSSATTKAIPLPWLTATDPVRVGSPVAFTTDVVFDYRNSLWKFQPLTQLTRDNAATVKPASFGATRPAAPAAVGGTVQIGTFNVLNYFTTTGDTLGNCTFYSDREGNPITVSGGCDARGAANAANLERQRAKIVAAVNKTTADVLALNEVENSLWFGKDRDDALSRLVLALNASAPGTWDYVRSPNARPGSEDVIRTAFIYRVAAVEPVGTSVILDDPAFSNARQPLAQSFKAKGAADSAKFLAIANHFKSKSGSGATGANADQGDGQGAYNADRVAQAKALVAFAAQQQAAQGTDKVFLLGDFNAYAKEDPVKEILAAGYSKTHPALGKQSYAFGGAVGSLDHVFASPAAASAVTGQDVWNINSPEPVAFEYSRYNYNATLFYAPDQYRASDHDPILVGANL
ncbi:ExeM/NucH family extracellular endonuclease [Sinomonas halotolerans]|uniref:ExeM/NucH family extracellular endonuclease n=1 Tax=Sinomonas halotolerans TaxID=1644133 RepID=A0ABU9X099_9MICC